MGKNTKHTKGEREEGTSLKNILIKILIGVSIPVISTIILYLIFGRSSAPPPPPLQVEELIVTASVDDPNPPQYSKVLLTVIVTDQNKKLVSGVEVEATIKYKTKPRKENGITNKYGEWKLPIRISSATVGFKVVIDVRAHLNNLVDKTITSFTPVPKLK